MDVVGLDNHLHQLVAHDVFFVEVDKLNAFDVGQNSFSFDQAASFPLRQVYLRDVAGDNGFGAKADSRQEHLHLFAGSVLRFIQNDECIGQRAPAHERQRRNFDDSFLQQASDAFVVDQIKQSVVKRAQVGIDLVL